jgi:hypothetical protein
MWGKHTQAHDIPHFVKKLHFSDEIKNASFDPYQFSSFRT